MNDLLSIVFKKGKKIFKDKKSQKEKEANKELCPI
jgi:hypothetical protein